MALEYRFLDRTDEALIRTSELPVEDGIAVAVRTTGYDTENDEVLELAIVDFAGNELFSQVVKPQNAEDWADGDASGGITPADVEEAPELFQFEEEISDLFENASIVVAPYADFLHEVIEGSWVSLPPYDSFSLVTGFCESHCAADYPGQPAAVASLESIAAYYRVECDESSAVGLAHGIAACYLKLVGEHADERQAKGAEYWERYEQKLREEELADTDLQARNRNAQRRTLLVNALLWLAGGAIFSNLAVQLYTRGYDTGFAIVAAAVSVFCFIRWGMCLYQVHKLRK